MIKIRKVGISLRITEAQEYFEKRDSLSHDWPPLLEKLGIIPILIPNTLSNIENFLQKNDIDGIILSGGDNIGNTPERDKTEFEIISFGIKKNIPIFGVCRGMQIINKYFEGSVRFSNSNHSKGKHIIEIIKPFFQSVLKTKSFEVNSYHNNTITYDTLGNDLESFAIYNRDSTIEGFYHKELPIIGVMWHLERQPDKKSELILRNVFHNLTDLRK